jgi:DNA-binding MarR family transcriptional regulator
MYEAVEAFYYGHRAIVGLPDEVLAAYGLSRMHHRIMYFVARHPGLSVNELLCFLGITKQSLNVPMRKLLDDGFILAVPDSKDKRIKRLTLSDTARALETEITGYQIQLLEKAFAAVGDEAKESWLRVMRTLVQQTS